MFLETSNGISGFASEAFQQKDLLKEIKDIYK